MKRTRLRIRVQPRASRTEVVRYTGETLWLRVTASPERGQANAAALELLAKALGLAKSRISVVRGRTSREKVMEIEGLTGEELRRRLAAG